MSRVIEILREFAKEIGPIQGNFNERYLHHCFTHKLLNEGNICLYLVGQIPPGQVSLFPEWHTCKQKLTDGGRYKYDKKEKRTMMNFRNIIKSILILVGLGVVLLTCPRSTSAPKNIVINTPLRQALESHKFDEAVSLIKSGADLNIKLDSNRTYQHLLMTEQAAYHYHLGEGDLENYDNIVKMMKEAGLGFNDLDELGLAPLHYAVMNYDWEVIKILLKNGADINIKSSAGFTPFMIAVGKKPGWALSCILLYNMLNAGADINSVDSSGTTALMLATQAMACKEVYKFLLARGANIDLTRKDGQNVLDIGIFECTDRNDKGKLNWLHASDNIYMPVELLKILKYHGAKVHAGRTDYHSIVEAIIADDTLGVKYWLDKGVPVNFLTDKVDGGRGRSRDVSLLSQSSLLAHSVEYNSPCSFDLLIKQGADLSYKGRYGFTLLHIAADVPNPYFTERLIALGLDINEQSSIAGTPIFIAALYGNAPIFQALMKAGAKTDIEARIDSRFSIYDRDKYPLIAAAVVGGNIDIVSQLINDQKIIKKSGGEALRTAVGQKNPKIVELLLKAGIDPNKTGSPSAMKIATQNQDWEITKLLQTYGAKE